MNIRLVVSIFTIFATGVISGFFMYSFVKESPIANIENSSKQIRQMSQYTYINPLLECEVAEGVIDARKENFHDEVEVFIDTLKKEKKISEVAFYFRDLNDGPTFGVDQEGQFFPASLLKVPVMMVYYHLAERDRAVLMKEITFDIEVDLGLTPTILPRESLQVGTKYKVSELIERMIKYSDNQALFLLSSRLPISELQELFAMLGVDSKVLQDADAKLTVKEYAGFFRILFNSSYLSREFSEKSLALLTSTDYNDALPAGVPAGTAVAHKFGEAGTGDIERQLHDCGIVYFPSHPYLACIMTRGQDTKVLKESIVEISKFIYEKIDEQY